jgi:hypothetical protein
MRLILGALAAAAIVYAGVFVALALQQRSMLYQPRVGFVSPALAGLDQFEVLRLKTDDGETLEAWFAAPKDARRPLILYFHGNGGSLVDREGRFRRLAQRGYGLLAISYRGYGGSTGAPSEAGLLRDAETAYGETWRRGFAPGRIVIMGESLGTGVATIIAARHDAAALVLDSPFASIVDVASTHFPMFPVSFALRDRFRADEAIGKTRAPVLMVVGLRDPVTPAESARKLFALAREPKTLIELPEAGHIAMDSPGALERAMDWIDATVAKATPAYGPSR